MLTDHRGCAHNAERSPFRGLGLGPCGGMVRHYRRTILGLNVPAWLCDLHAVTHAKQLDETERENTFWQEHYRDDEGPA